MAKTESSRKPESAASRRPAAARKVPVKVRLSPADRERQIIEGAIT